jgi:hypothetical protein
MECDVLIAGGGSAGMAAAIAAARMGARTLLVERHGFLGGMAPAALVHSICGLYRLPGGDSGPIPANAGFAWEFATRLLAAGGASGPELMGRMYVLLQRPAAFARLADAMVRENPLLEVRLHTELIAAGETVSLACRGRIEEVRARVFVDATGDAALAVMRGAPCEMEDAAHLQRPAYIFALGGVEAAAADEDARLRLAQRIAQAVKNGDLPGAALGAHLRASGQAGEVFVTIDLAGGPDFNPLDPACLTRLEMDGRDVADQLGGFLRAEIPGFSKSYIAAWPARMGVRESRRVIGRYRIEAEDIECGAEFEDAVAFAAWPMELRETARGPRWRFPTGRQPCGIPLRALRAKEDDALFMAGRCISCAHEAQASLRVIGTCMATGEAAGLAAALKVFHGECDASGVIQARAQIAR